MSKKLLLVVVLFVCACLLSACGAAMATSPVTGMLYSDVKGPLAVTSNIEYIKIGEASCESILGLVARGDASISAAMKDGKITKIHHVDYHSENILGIYAKFTVTVYGE